MPHQHDDIGCRVLWLLSPMTSRLVKRTFVLALVGCTELCEWGGPVVYEIVNASAGVAAF
jgi:hypothetical protein